MNELPDSTSALRPEAPTHDQGTTVVVRVGEESADQVVLAGGAGSAHCTVSAIQGSTLELRGATFFPKNTQLTVAVAGGAGIDAGLLTGIVRRVQMVAMDPAYAVSLRLTEGDPNLLGALRDHCADAPVPGQEAALETALGAGATPGWATRLVGDGSLSQTQLEEVMSSALADAVPLDEALVEAGLVLAEHVARYMAMDLGVPFVAPTEYDIRLANAALVPEELARRHQLFPLFDVGGVITLGMTDPSDLAVIDQVRLRASAQVDQCLVTSSTVDMLIERAYGSASVALPLSAEAGSDDDPSAAASSDNEIVRLVHTMVEESARDGVSDVHIEPERDKLRVRIRLDGVLHERSIHPRQQHAPIVSRIKVLAKLDIAETRRPQDGHFSMSLRAGNVDVRVSTLPTVHGENVVLRLLLSDGEPPGLEELGMSPDTLGSLVHFLAQPNGMILVTGPTGSGKTTTLYAALARLRTIERNVVTVEDPVEKRMSLVRQTEVNTKAGLTFASGLRSILRQDPDVIMIGEIRDKETSEIAVQAALTGHLVLSTLHTNSAADALIRLSEIGIAPFLITASLRAVVSQRLARRVCESCRTEVEPDPRLLAAFGLQPDGTRFMVGAGCARCFRTGYQGRVGVYELLPLTDGLASTLLSGASRDVIEKEARAARTTSLRADGLRRVREGLTTLEEVARIAGIDQLDPAHPTEES